MMSIRQTHQTLKARTMNHTGNHNIMQGAQAGLLESPLNETGTEMPAGASVTTSPELSRPVLIYDNK